MPIVDLTKFNPYAGESERSWRNFNARQQALQGALQGLRDNLQRGIERRQKLAAENQQIRDREYNLINRATDQLVQPQTNSKITDVQIQQTGQKIKQEYYDAIKAYENSDKGDEARQAFEQAKQRALSSARTISGALDALSAQTEAFRQSYNNGGVSDAVNPAVREFMADLIDPDTPKDKYVIQPDPETGELRYVDTETGGENVNFLLDDIANGENQFTSMTKTNMASTITNLMKDVTTITKQEERDWGVAEVTDWEAIGQQLDGRIDELIKDETNFRKIAAELGYGYNDFMAVKNGEAIVDDQEEGADDITNLDQLKDAVKRELLQQIESVTPHSEKAIIDNRATVADQVAAEQASQIALQTSQGIEQVIASGDVSGFNQYLGKPAVVKGLKGQIASINMKGNKAEITVRSGQKGGAKQSFDLSNQNDLALFQSIITGQDYNLIKQANINSLLLE